MIGYNTPSVNAEKSEEGPRSGCSTTGSPRSWCLSELDMVVCVAKAGVEDVIPDRGT